MPNGLIHKYQHLEKHTVSNMLSEMLETTCESTHHCNPEDQHCHLHCCENLTFHIDTFNFNRGNLKSITLFQPIFFPIL
jgi:hypothetical protein